MKNIIAGSNIKPVNGTFIPKTIVVDGKKIAQSFRGLPELEIT